MNIPLTIRNSSEAIIANLSQEDIDVYLFLMEQFESTADIRENYLFHFVFRSFYRLDYAFLSNEMKIKYFNLMQELRDSKDFDFALVCGSLYNIPNQRGENSLQFSFATKMAHTISPNCYPIYDSAVAAMFGFKAPSNKEYNQRLDKCCDFYKHVSEQYNKFIEDENLKGVFLDLKEQRKNIEKLSAIKKLDFLMWSAGKLKLKSEKSEKNKKKLRRIEK